MHMCNMYTWYMPERLTPPLLPQGVVSNGQSSALGYSYAALMFVGLIIGTLCDNQHFQRVMRAGAGTCLLPVQPPAALAVCACSITSVCC